jgi:hypothetical protein
MLLESSMSFGQYPDGCGIEVVAKLMEELFNLQASVSCQNSLGCYVVEVAAVRMWLSSSWPKSAVNAVAVSRYS